ncbi:MAG: hypothetical protein ACRDPD_15730 [Streptosporangiaceae bacterium]
MRRRDVGPGPEGPGRTANRGRTTRPEYPGPKDRKNGPRRTSSKNNRFGQQYYAKGGQFGAVAYYNPAGTGNSWTSNVWDTTGLTIASPTSA